MITLNLNLEKDYLKFKDQYNGELCFLNIAKEIANMSKCVSHKVGSLIVKDKRIISTAPDLREGRDQEPCRDREREPCGAGRHLATCGELRGV